MGGVKEGQEEGEHKYQADETLTQTSRYRVARECVSFVVECLYRMLKWFTANKSNIKTVTAKEWSEGEAGGCKASKPGARVEW